ncbi:hypothetical protein R3P38DRAFT_3356120 [Favolaschia claudopus]|uniref:Uncharacterized protein n=1 Tax=Favolaschia claudopus TaxID=2862362 RepID=A0AAW0BF67_9AGAR
MAGYHLHPPATYKLAMPAGFADLPAELMLLLSTCLPIPSLHALVLTCRRPSHHDILQPELEALARITPEIASNALRRAVTESKPHLVSKFISPPHSVNPGTDTWYFSETPLSENLEIARMLLEAGANPNVQWGQDDELPLEIAFRKRNVELMTLRSRRENLANDPHGARHRPHRYDAAASGSRRGYRGSSRA